MFTEWNDWTTCTESCGSVLQSRTRKCLSGCDRVAEADLTETLNEEWEVTSERCWHRCGQKGGKCSYCGENGYCCRNTHHPWNGDCPAEAIEITRTYGHDCVQKKEG